MRARPPVAIMILGCRGIFEYHAVWWQLRAVASLRLAHEISSLRVHLRSLWALVSGLAGTHWQTCKVRLT